VGTVVTSRRLHSGCGALSFPLVARVVPDVSGIDKSFDYIVPTAMADSLVIGDRVRINLHGRRVGGWVVAVGHWGEDDFTDIPLEKLQPIAKHSGQGVEPELVSLTDDIALHFCGPRRAVLQSASAPKVTRTRGRERHGVVQAPDNEVTSLLPAVPSGVHVMRIGPLDSVLSLVVALAVGGPVLVVCPTIRMAVLGAASLRRRGCVVALAPDDWDQCVDGVDVVIGARSAVWAPCRNMSAIVVVDEHDDALKEERVPTWHARDVALRRAENAGVPCFLCSPSPSVHSLGLVQTDQAVELWLKNSMSWPQIEVVDLKDVPVAGSLASSELLELTRDTRSSVLCVLNTKGGARLSACAACRAIARCEKCQSALETKDSVSFVCRVCDVSTSAVCQTCGRTSFRVLRSGITRLRDQLAQASGRPVVEVDATVEVENIASADNVYVGTEALLHRVNSANHVVFLDFDSEILAPRVGAGRDALSLIIRATRIVGSSGSILVQTRDPKHPLVEALSRVHGDAEALRSWEHKDLQLREALSLPPYFSIARVTLDASLDASHVFANTEVTWARENDMSYLVRARDVGVLQEVLHASRKTHGAFIRVDLDPVRY
jgi:primosomal protein N' (replication factor Y) (superfamily II helicase)